MGWVWVWGILLVCLGTHWSRTGPLNPTHFWHWKRPCGSIFALIASSLARPSVPQTLSCNPPAGRAHGARASAHHLDGPKAVPYHPVVTIIHSAISIVPELASTDAQGRVLPPRQRELARRSHLVRRASCSWVVALRARPWLCSWRFSSSLNSISLVLRGITATTNSLGLFSASFAGAPLSLMSVRTRCRIRTFRGLF